MTITIICMPALCTSAFKMKSLYTFLKPKSGAQVKALSVKVLMPHPHHRAFFGWLSLPFQMPRMPYRVTQMALCAGSPACRALKPHPTPNTTAPPAHIIPVPIHQNRSPGPFPSSHGPAPGQSQLALCRNHSLCWLILPALTWPFNWEGSGMRVLV